MTEPKFLSIVVGTTNRGKLAEFRALLADLPVEVLALADVAGAGLSLVEDGDSFEANAAKKAQTVAAATQLVTLADDSGLEVDALGGRPGVRSARFAAEGATDAQNNAALLALMQDVEDEARQARFRCAVALVDPWFPDQVTVVHGRCEGVMARSPTGTGGFGYDPLFIVDGIGRTMAELEPEQKNVVSHRARALLAIKPQLVALLGQRLAEAARILGDAVPEPGPVNGSTGMPPPERASG